MNAHTRRTSLVLICLMVLTQAAAVPSRARVLSQQSAHLYQVSMRDEKSGEKKIGFIDQSGKLVIGFDRLPKTTKAVGEFHEGRAVIYLTKEAGDESMDATAGYIDESGEVIIAPRYELARDFSEGLAYVEAEGIRGFIDRQGKVVIKVDDLHAKDFHEGMAAVGTRQWRGEWGYIDRSGKLVIKPQYRFADNFSEGLAGVEVDGKYGFINQRGEMVIAPRFEPHRGHHGFVTVGTSRFVEGIACVRIDELYGYINRKGEFVIAAQFSQAQEFSEGLAWVVTRDKKTADLKKAGWIDKSGRWVVTGVNGRSLLDVQEFYGFVYSEGLAPFLVYLEDRYRWGYMDRKGIEVIKPAFAQVSRFIGGVAWVSVSGRGEFAPEEKYGYIDKSGRFIWGPR